MINLTRGDTGRYKFQRLDFDGNVLSTIPSAIYFTVKNSFDDTAFIFQKTIVDFTKDSAHWWHFVIEPSDTETLPCGNYVYDIEVTDEDITTISKGSFELKKEATWKVNKNG